MRAARWVGAATLLAVASSACSLLEPRRDETKYYVLASSDELSHAGHEAAASAASVGIGPVELPAYVVRAAIIRRTSPTEIDPSTLHVWAEPIDRSFERVLARDVQLALGAPAVASYPWQLDRAPRWQVAVDVVRFEVDEHGTALLVARWRAIEWPSRAVKAEREVRLTAPSRTDDTAELTRALSEVVDQFAGEIARGIAELH